MKQFLAKTIQAALATLKEQGVLTFDTQLDIQIDHTRDKQFGDFASNIAMLLSKIVKKPPRLIAEMIVKAIQPCQQIQY